MRLAGPRKTTHANQPCTSESEVSPFFFFALGHEIDGERSARYTFLFHLVDAILCPLTRKGPLNGSGTWYGHGQLDTQKRTGSLILQRDLFLFFSVLFRCSSSFSLSPCLFHLRCPCPSPLFPLCHRSPVIVFFPFFMVFPVSAQRKLNETKLLLLLFSADHGKVYEGESIHGVKRSGHT